MSAPLSPWTVRWPLFVGFATVIALVGGLGGWSVTTTLAGAVIAPGQVEVAQSRQVVQHPDGGVVETIFVTEGMHVVEGDILLRLDGSDLKSELAIVENRLLELDATAARLEAQSTGAPSVQFPAHLVSSANDNPEVSELLASQTRIFEQAKSALYNGQHQQENRIEQIQNQIVGIRAQQEAITSQIALLTTDLKTLGALLDQGLTQAARVSAVQRELAELKGNFGELISAEASALGRIAEIRIEIDAIASQERARAETELSTVVADQRVARERQSFLMSRILRLDVRAPATGIVLGLQVNTPQSVVRAADTLMFIVPQDRPLIVSARVPVTHVDEVFEGQVVKLVFPSLPSRTTPALSGRLARISPDAFTDERSGAAFYRAEIEIDRSGQRDRDGVKLVPGMPATVFLRTEDRTPLSYLLKPFTDYFDRAMRET